MLSDGRIQKLAEKFVCVKVDPRDRGADRDALEHKSTNYVPEVVFLSPEGEVIDRLEDRSVEGVAEVMEAVLGKVKRRAGAR